MTSEDTSLSDMEAKALPTICLNPLSPAQITICAATSAVTAAVSYPYLQGNEQEQTLEPQHRKFLVVLVWVSVAFLLFVAPIPQDPSYHAFADKRGFRCACGGGGFTPQNIRGRLVVPNFMDVVSNIVLLLGGLTGLLVLPHVEKDVGNEEDWQQTMCLPVFFWSTAVVSVGSAYYHWWPSNATLVWDRLPMTLAFMASFCLILDERLSSPNATSSVGQVLFYPLLVLGASSVVYWHFTNDLRPYAIVQFLPLLCLPIMFVLFEPQYTHQEHWIAALGLYILAKVCEVKDYEIYNWTGRSVSGHSLKHIVAGMVPFTIAHMVLVRQKYLLDELFHIENSPLVDVDITGACRFKFWSTASVG